MTVATERGEEGDGEAGFRSDQHGASGVLHADKHHCSRGLSHWYVRLSVFPWALALCLSKFIPLALAVCLFKFHLF